ncbi:MAG: DUF2817 domain-containing protein [Myxococcales bacterium]
MPTGDSALTFSPDYATARARFRDAARDAGFELTAYAIGQVAPDGTDLTLDVARKGTAQARRVLVVSSGTHGVEGFFGSAVQLAALEGLFSRVTLPSHVAVVMVHANNPFGFAWSRRVNEHNVDQNRNFLLEGASFSGAPEAYRELDGLLNPKNPPARFEPFLLKAAREVLKRGFPALKTAVATGQYEFPQGLFFGGHAPSRVQELWREHGPSWIGKPERVLHVDFHTGLGKWGSYALCVDLPAQHPRVAALSREFGAKFVQGFDTKGVLYEIRGGLGRWLEQCFEGVQYDTLLAEFGTYTSLRVLSAMRFENRSHHYASDRPRLLARARAELREVFSPASPSWRRMVVARGVHIVEQALTACST